MKICRVGLKIAVLLALFFGGVSAMPDVSPSGSGIPTVPSGMPTLPSSGIPVVPPTNYYYDKKVEADLITLRGHTTSVKAMLDTLKTILGYVGSRPLTVQTQTDYFNAVKNFDIYARNSISGLSENDISAIVNFLNKLKNSTLIPASGLVYISSAMQYWQNKGNKGKRGHN
jgi:hypothetical protein